MDASDAADFFALRTSTPAVYASAARLSNASPGEIALTENNTRGWVVVVEALDLAEGVVVKPVDKATGRLDLSERGRVEAVRASVHAYNNEADLEQLERSLHKLLA